MFLLIDWGNTWLKYHLVDNLSAFTGDEKALVSKTVSSPEVLLERIKNYQIENITLSNVLVSSVRSSQDNQQLTQLLEKIGLTPVFAKTERALGDVQCGYIDYQLLGIDRWLTIIAASQKDRVIGIIDIGSAITLDIVKSRAHLGGHILPGETLLKNSLLKTANVKVGDKTKQALAEFELGRSTKECVDFGVEQMIGGYLITSINQANKNYKVKRWVITGGGGEYWSNWLKKFAAKESSFQIKHKPNLVFQGLVIYYTEKSKK